MSENKTSLNPVFIGLTILGLTYLISGDIILSLSFFKWYLFVGILFWAIIFITFRLLKSDLKFKEKTLNKSIKGKELYLSLFNRFIFKRFFFLLSFFITISYIESKLMFSDFTFFLLLMCFFIYIFPKVIFNGQEEKDTILRLKELNIVKKTEK